MSTKTKAKTIKENCRRCGKFIPLSEFVKCSARPRGYGYHCKQCDVKRSIGYNASHYDAHKKRVRQSSKRKYLPYRKMVLDFLEKIHAKEFNFQTNVNPYSVVRQAIKKGVLVKPKHCEICQKEKPIKAHHENYARPLDVIWVCNQCHRHIHEIYNEN